MEFESLELRAENPHTNRVLTIKTKTASNYCTGLAAIYNALPDGDDWEKNKYEYAKLFAAAPELFDACKQFRSAFLSGDSTEMNNAACSAAIAIAKAEDGK